MTRLDTTQAVCADLDPEIWFTLRRVEEAKQHCQTCPIQQACLADAMGRGEQHGVWGGRLFEPYWVVLTRQWVQNRRAAAQQRPDLPSQEVAA